MVRSEELRYNTNSEREFRGDLFVKQLSKYIFADVFLQEGDEQIMGGIELTHVREALSRESIVVGSPLDEHTSQDLVPSRFLLLETRKSERTFVQCVAAFF